MRLQPQFDWPIPRRYEIKKQLGQGSYGLVVEAFDHETNQLVAIKQIHKVFSDLLDCKRILREIAIMRRLQHDNIIKLIDICVPSDPANFDDLHYVMEIADSDFKKLFRQPATFLELEHVTTLMYHLLHGVQFLHSAGVFHRDLKPGNCLVNHDCCVRICDFGLARTVDTALSTAADPLTAEQGTELTHKDEEGGELVVGFPATLSMKKQLTGHVVTRWYRAPELILLQKNYTESIDVWSSGCIFAELLGMMKGTCPVSENRAPLFPGRSCFPLSPDHKNLQRFANRSNKDQLNMIFDVIGTPAEEDIHKLEKEEAKKYISLFDKRGPQDLSKRFLGAPAHAVDLLKRMLVFDPDKRITVGEALNHKFFEGMPKEPAKPVPKVRLPFDDWKNMDAPSLRLAFLQEIKQFHPEMQIPASVVKAAEASSKR